jgi:phosphate transport system protein
LASVFTVMSPPKPRDRARRAKPIAAGSAEELTKLALKAGLIARDATFNMLELLRNSSRMAYLAIRDCEKELDQIERYIDEHVPGAITQVSESKARQLLASLKAITDLERIGDLVFGVAQRLHARSQALPLNDAENLLRMTVILHDMLEQIHEGFVTLNMECAKRVLRVDAELDQICHSFFRKHLTDPALPQDTPAFEIPLMAQALERAGDHAKNLAEELVSLIEGHTARHPPKRRPVQ